MKYRFAQELKVKIQKEKDHPLPKKSKIARKDKEDSGDERKMLVIQVCGTRCISHANITVVSEAPFGCVCLAMVVRQTSCSYPGRELLRGVP